MHQRINEWEFYIEEYCDFGHLRLRNKKFPKVTVGVHTDNEECYEACWPDRSFTNGKSVNCFGQEHDTIEDAINEAYEKIAIFEEGAGHA